MTETSVGHQLLRLHVLLGDDEAQLDELYQAFQETDEEGRGSLKSATELEAVLRRYLAPKEMKKIDVEALVAHFPTNSKRFDYTAFCKALQKPPSLQPESSQSGNRSPTKRRSRSRSRSPTRLQNREQARMRMDKRLESQRLLMESVRHKLLRGIQGDESEGYHGIQTALRGLDSPGDGYLAEKVFMKKFIQRLKLPLTRPERQFLLEQLRAQSTENEGGFVDYEQLGHICNLNSDDSLSESDTEQEQARPPSPSRTSQLGADFLAAEKLLNHFLRTPLAALTATDKLSTKPVPLQDTPRCMFTGAEKFLEIAEEIDRSNTGLLHEDEFPRILMKCGVKVDPELVLEMLSRFPRSSGKRINYAAFLQRYGQNPQCSRGRRELKQLVLHLLARLTVPITEWLRFLLKRFEKYDHKIHGALNGQLPTEVFLRAVQGRSAVLKLSTDEAAQVTSLFLRASGNNSPDHLRYHELLMFIDECHRTNIPLAIDANSLPRKMPTKHNLSPTSPQATKVSPSEPPAADSTLDVSNLSVGDYLMFHAAVPERRNFEALMELLQDFQHSLSSGSDAVIHPVANGILLPLGQRLRVKVQFSISESD